KALPNIVFQPRGSDFKAPHFVQYVQKILEDRYGIAAVEQGGLTVTTTLDLSLQEKAQNIVSEEIAKVEKQHITNGASVVVNPETGEILAMVGSKDFNAKDYDGQVNVTTSLRQPGSSFKPFTYVTGFKKGYTPATLLMDVPTTFPGGVGQPDYTPVNYDGKYRGPIQVRYALANSINVTAVKMLALAGIKDVLQTATDMGITTLPPTKETLSRVGLSLTLGGGEVKLLDMTTAYSAFVNKGFRVEPIAILKVTDVNGKVLEENKPQKGKQVLSEENAFLIDNILSDNNARKDVFGVNSNLNIPGKNVMVKTGTTNDKRDNWTMGGNSNAMVGVWVGNNDNSPMLNVASGVSGASPIWRRILLEAISGKPNVNFEKPENVVEVSVDAVSGFAAHDGFLARNELFAKGTEPGNDYVHVLLKICKSENKLASPGDVAGNNYDNKEYFIFKEENPPGVLAWLGGQGDARYHPPTEYCGTINPLSIDFVNPTDRSQQSNSFTIKVNPQSTSEVTQVELVVDNVSKGYFDLQHGNVFPITLSDGVHVLKAIAKDSGGHQVDKAITVGVNVPWDYASPTPTPGI
ncbi:MAG TPA: penicillin-binding transpeptidase domain-containing protein, partial [Alphaproteobacteria bacterium]|nr:penicillin-binding transpeptidase domain-containing protein [Alphaproteobacteria bacterium]